jgi:hypothetical protein
MTADDGRVWVRVAQAARLNSTVKLRTSPGGLGQPTDEEGRPRWIEPAVYDVLEPTGRYVGRVRVPDGLMGLAIRADTVWGMLRDSSDVPQVKRYHIRWPRG